MDCDKTYRDKYNLLGQKLKALKKVVVAYSGGVDSTFLLKAAVDVLGRENVLACIGISPSLSKSQYTQALENAALIGIDVAEIKIDELADGKYSTNNADRCFYCKSHLYAALREIGNAKGFTHIACGCNFDDMSDFRPGNKAAAAYGVHSPLMEAAMTKADIRSMSRELNLPTADIPASPCLASRVIYGLEINETRLGQVEQAEDFIRGLGFVEFRVRHHNEIARIEVETEEFEKLVKEPNLSLIVAKLKSIGFKYITLDLQGFRSGSLNESLTEKHKRDIVNGL